MGISICKKLKNHGDNPSDSPVEFLDIAPSRVFKDYWLRAANELRLDLIPLFPCLPLNEHDVCNLIAELAAVSEWAKAMSEKDQQYIAIRKRISLLQTFLSNIDWREEEADIGG